MKNTTIDKMTWSVFFLIIFVFLCIVGLFGWAVIELIQWITSK